jgi:hypothetical protein
MNIAEISSILGIDPSMSSKQIKQSFRDKTLNNTNNINNLNDIFSSFDELSKNIDLNDSSNMKPLASFNFGMHIDNEQLENIPVPSMEDFIMSASRFLGNDFNKILQKKYNNHSHESRVEEILEDPVTPTKHNVKPVKIYFDITFQQLYNGFYLYDLDNIEDVENINTIVPNQFVPPGVCEIYDSGIYHIIFNILPHDHFELKDDNLYYNYSISLKESLCGFDLNLKHINGKEYLIKNYNKIIKPFSEISIPKLGINKNDLVIKFFVDFPDKLDNDTIKKLELLFQDSKISP